ncbi:MAG: hypothetical protein Q7U74_11690 [Saprospiraceae bacterium]|nr:hypothetical protein [Saprospiraceae bacterium]
MRSSFFVAKIAVLQRARCAKGVPKIISCAIQADFLTFLSQKRFFAYFCRRFLNQHGDFGRIDTVPVTQTTHQLNFSRQNKNNRDELFGLLFTNFRGRWSRLYVFPPEMGG